MTDAALPDLDHEKFLRQSINLAVKSREAGNHPFAALLVSPDGDVLMEQMNDFGAAGDSTGHAERVLMTRASTTYPPEYLRGCTMYTSAEPCAMCAGSIYWAGVGRVVHGMSERALKDLIGPHPENLTLDLPCQKIFEAGQRPVEVVGPLLSEESAVVHKDFW
jgi:tRNA(Arg) A34 adenosine deaminase TadA